MTTDFKQDQPRLDFGFGMNLVNMSLKDEVNEEIVPDLGDQHLEFLNGKSSLISPVASRN